MGSDDNSRWIVSEVSSKRCPPRIREMLICVGKPAILVAKVSAVTVQSNATEEETEGFFVFCFSQCFIWEYNPKPAKARKKETETGKDRKPH